MGASVTITINANGRNAAAVIAQLRTALAGLSAQQAQNTRQANQFASALGRIRNQAIALKIAFEGAQFFQRFIQEGLKFNQVVESGILAIGALITATGRLVDSEGKVLVGAEALGEGMKFAADQVNKLRVDGLRTAATTEQLIDAFQQATGAGIAAGLTLDQIRRTTVQIVLAAQGLGVPMNQLNQEVRSILEATIDRNSRVARILGITNAQVRLQREQGTLAEFLNQKLQAFTVASEKSLDTWQVIKSNMVEAFQVLAGDITKPFFNKVKQGFKDVLAAAFDFDRAQISDAFRGLVEGGQSFFSEFGDIITEAIRTAVQGAQDLSVWFRANRTEVQLFVKELGETARAIGSVVGEVIRVLVGIAKWGIESGTFNAVLNTIQLSLKVIEKFIKVALVGAIIKATLGMGAFANAIGKAALGLSGIVRIFQALGATTLLAGFATPIGVAVLALGALAVVLSLVKARQDAINAQRQAFMTKLVNEKAAVTDLSTSYIALAHDVTEGNAANQELVTTLTGLAAIAEDLAKKNDDFSQAAGRHALALRQQAAAIAQNVTARENLSVETQKLEAALTKADLKGPDRIRIQTRIKEITEELVKLEREYTKMVNDSTEAVRKNIELQEQAAAARAATAEGELQAAMTIMNGLKETRAALQAAVGGTNDLQLRRELKEDIAELTTRIDRYSISIEHMEAGVHAAKEAHRRLREELDKKPVKIESVGGFTEGDAAKRAAAKRQAEEDFRKSIEAQIELVRGTEKRLTSELETALANNEIGITEFHDRILDAQLDAINQIIVLRTRLFNALSEQGDKNQQLGEIKELKQAELEVVTDADRKFIKGRKDLNEELLRARQALQEAEGKLVEASNAEIERKYGELLARLRKEGDVEGVEIVMRLKNVEQVKAGVDVLFNRIELHQAGLETNIATVQAQVSAGAVKPIEAQQKIIKLYEEHGKAIDLARKQLLLYMAVSKDPSVAPKIEELNLLWAENELAIQKAKDSMDQFKVAIFETIEQGFVEFLTTDIGKLSDFGDAFRNMAISIVKSIQRMVAEMIAFQAVMAIFRVFGASVPTSVQAPFTPGIVQAASGGFIKGPGTETSDSIPARLSRGEYVLSAKTVRSLGVSLLDQLNFGASRPRLRNRRHFAEGGLVAPDMQQGARGELTATIGLEDGLILKGLTTAAARVAILKIVSRNPKAFQAALSSG